MGIGHVKGHVSSHVEILDSLIVFIYYRKVAQRSDLLGFWSILQPSAAV